MKYEASKKSRINYGFCGITTFVNGWWWHENDNKWINHNNPLYISQHNGYSSHQPCRSVKSFKRKLTQCPSGVEFILVSRWVGHCVYGKNTSK